METLESRVSRLEYYIKLLSGTSEQEAKPFIDLVVRNQLTKKEVEEILILCEDTKNEYIEQKAEGLTDFVPLLTQFVGMLNYKLTPRKTVESLRYQPSYQDVMNEFFEIIQWIRD
ncbi:DUF1878 family protein [Priestia megaterium]|uniref:DUF1878 family protein n=1 Tax=Priestia megaterium TaxID=1404 RepID=UPI000BF33AD8|nr:DUF1878 family protein [Priestia megaterium]PFD95998.1 hypothetical protein CN265_25325 [Priestia megaterium]